MKSNLHILFYLITILISCNRDTIYEEFYDSDKKLLKVRGYLSPSRLENGEWSYFDSLSMVTKSGICRDGFKTGKWFYKTGKKQFNIEWERVADTVGGFTTISPKNYVRVHSNEYMYVCKKNDLINPITIIAQKKILNSEQTISSYKDTVIKAIYELTDSLIDYTCQVQKFESGKSFYCLASSFYVNGKIFYTYNMLGEIKKNELIDIACYFSKDSSEEGNNVFFDILSHFYIDDIRFFTPFEKKISSGNDCK